MRLMKVIKTFLTIWCLILVIILFKISPNLVKDEENIILWWTHFIGDFNHIRNCGDIKCFFTENRSYFNDTNLRAFLFYGSNMNTTNFPLPRLKHQIWGLLHEESPKNIPFIMFPSALALFNITSTFSRYSNSPLTLQYLNSLDDLLSTKYFLNVDEKNKFKTLEKLSPILYIQSICNTMSKRDEYVQELSKYIKIDSYGKCLNNKTLPDSLSNDYLRTIESENFYKFIAKYKFVISYENGVCNDYISEKLWRPLIVGIIPIYFGSPTVKDWLPNEKSAIIINDFDNPKKLAEYINYLDSNDFEYTKYFKHKIDKIHPVSNDLLIETLNKKRKNFDIIENFECLVCRLSVDNRNEYISSVKDYDCDQRLSYPKMDNFYHEREDDQLWEEFLQQGKCEAQLINNFIHLNKSYSDEKFNAELLKRYQLDLC